MILQNILSCVLACLCLVSTLCCGSNSSYTVVGEDAALKAVAGRMVHGHWPLLDMSGYMFKGDSLFSASNAVMSNVRRGGVWSEILDSSLVEFTVLGVSEKTFEAIGLLGPFSPTYRTILVLAHIKINDRILYGLALVSSVGDREEWSLEGNSSEEYRSRPDTSILTKFLRSNSAIETLFIPRKMLDSSRRSTLIDSIVDFRSIRICYPALEKEIGGVPEALRGYAPM